MGWAVRCGGEYTTHVSLYYSYSLTSDFSFEIDFSRRGDVSTTSGISRLLTNDANTAGFYMEGQYLASHQIGYIVLVPHAAGERFTLRIQRTSSTLRIYKNNAEIHSRTDGNVFNNLYLSGQGPTGIDLSRIALSAASLGISFNAVSSLSGGIGTVIPYQSASASVAVSPQLINPQLANASWISVTDAPAVSKPLKYHNGTAWVEKPLKYHNGTTWVAKPLKTV